MYYMPILRKKAENNDVFLRKCLDSWRICSNFAAQILRIMKERYIYGGVITPDQYIDGEMEVIIDERY